MSTRNTTGANILGLTTEYSMHVSQRSSYILNVIDYGEKRLLKHLAETTDQQQINALNELLKNYVKGKIALAWRGGKPCYIRVTKENMRSNDE
jgi:hypothetical protein